MARPNLTQHRKFRRLVRSLGSAITARGSLELLWDACYESGDEYLGTSDDIENLVGWTGERGVLTRALVEAGFPEGQGFIEPVSAAVDGAAAYRVHDLWHHAPDYVAKRRKRELDRRQRLEPVDLDRRTAPNGGQWPTSPDCQIEVGRTPAPAPAPALAPDKNSAEAQELFEARRLAQTQGPIEARARGFLDFPVIGPGSGMWTLSEAQVAEWVSLFPGVDVRGEARKALAWVQASPTRRKTQRGMARFLVGWFSRTADRGGARVPVATGRTPTSEAWECPHPEPKCLGRWKCHQRTALEQAKRQGVG